MTLIIAPHSIDAVLRKLLRGSATGLRRLAVVLAALALSACATNLGGSVDTTAALGEQKPLPGNGKPQKPVRIAMILPLAGYSPTAATAKGMKQAGEMALFELDNPLVQIIVKDDKGTPVGAAAAADEAIREGAEIIVGPLTAGATTAIAPVARKANVPVLTFSNDRRVAGNGVYLMSFLPEQEIDRIVTFAASKGKRTYAALVPDDAYGVVVEEAFRRAVERNGGRVVALGKYPADVNAMLTPVKGLMDSIRQSADSGMPVDTLLLAGGAEVLPQIGPLMSYSGLNGSQIKLIGTGGWDYPNAGRNAALAGGWYPAPDPHGWQDFAQRFSRSFGTTPPRLATLSYDAVSFAITLGAYEPGQRYTAANLTRANGFNGVDGTVRFSAEGLPDRSLAVLEIQTFGASVIDPSPGGALPAASTSAVSAAQSPERAN
jgi:ABC-type branched-subunit amino acid transport system substrate-binding protein